MNEFATALSAALHEEAKEIAMSADMQQAQRQLEDSIRSADRRRRAWVAVAAAAAVVVVAGLAFGLNRPSAQPGRPGPSPTQPARASVPYPLDAFMLTPPLTAQLPGWVTSPNALAVKNQGNVSFGAGYCSNPTNPTALCPNGQDRAIRLLSVRYMYPLDATKITEPSYAQYVNDWKAVQRLGYGTVSDVTTTTVGGKPATTMTVSLTKGTFGLAQCLTATSPKVSDPCYQTLPARTLYLAIVNHGSGQPLTLLFEGLNAANTADARAVATEFTTWLATVRFP
jgi:hypothetical protein